MARDRVSRKTYVNDNGEKVESIFDATGVMFEFFDPDATKPDDAGDDWQPPVVATRVTSLADLEESAPEGINVTNALALHGLAQKGGDSYAGRKEAGKDAWEMFDDVIAQLSQGEWRERRGEGTASSATLIAQAIEQVLTDEGYSVDDATRARIKESVGTPEQRKEALKRPDIKAAYEKIAAERKAEAARKAAEKAAQFKAEGPSLAESLGLAQGGAAQ